MAIIKFMNSKFGLALAYHRITAVSVNYAQRKVTLCVASYLSKQTRANRNVPLEEIDIEIPVMDFPFFMQGSPIEQGYLWLKGNVVGFEDAVDDFDVMEPLIPYESSPPHETEPEQG